MTYEYSETPINKNNMTLDLHHSLTWNNSDRVLTRSFNSAGSPYFGVLKDSNSELNQLQLRDLWNRMLKNPKIKNKSEKINKSIR